MQFQLTFLVLMLRNALELFVYLQVGSTPLHIAAEFNLHTVVKCLLDRGFRADEKNMVRLHLLWVLRLSKT